MEKKFLPHSHGEEERLEKMQEHLCKEHTFEKVASIFDLLSDPTRAKIYWVVCHCEECVMNISSLLNMSSPAVSHHLRKLKDCGLIESRRDGKEVFYKAVENEQGKLLHQTIEKVMDISCLP